MNISKTITAWAKKTDPKIELAETFQAHTFYTELCRCTHASARIVDDVMQKSFTLDVLVPHERRSATYFMGPEDKDEINDPIEFFVPDFSTEHELGRALDVVYKRFLTEYGGQRFEDTAPELAPDILATANEWADWKDAEITVEIAEDNNAILVFIPESGSAGIGSELQISRDRSTSQNLLETSSGTLNAVPGYLPPFFTAPELRGALEAAFDVLKQG